jgi:hypothetical protein
VFSGGGNYLGSKQCKLFNEYVNPGEDAEWAPAAVNEVSHGLSMSFSLIDKGDTIPISDPHKRVSF